MTVWDLCINELIRTTQGLNSSQKASETWVELEMLRGYNIVASKQHKVVND